MAVAVIPTMRNFSARPPARACPRHFLVLVVAFAGTLPLARAQAPTPSQAVAASTEPAIAAAEVRWVCNTLENCQAVGLLGMTQVVDPIRFSASDALMGSIISLAYGLPGSQIKGLPQWVGWDSYQIEITAVSPVSKTQMEQVLLRKVIDQCFSIRAATVTKPVPGYALVVASGGIRFKATETQLPRSRPVDGVMTLSSLSQLVDMLNSFYYNNNNFGVTRPVMDATGLTGFYRIPFPVPGSLEPGEYVLNALRPLGLEVKSAPGTDTRLQIEHMDYMNKSCIIGSGPTNP